MYSSWDTFYTSEDGSQFDLELGFIECKGAKHFRQYFEIFCVQLYYILMSYYLYDTLQK